MLLSFHPDARDEVVETAVYYDGQAPGLGEEFIGEVEQVVALIAKNPAVGGTYLGETRRVLVRRFPYSVVYRSAPGEIRVLAVAHQHRRPGYWRGRA